MATDAVLLRVRSARPSVAWPGAHLLACVPTEEMTVGAPPFDSIVVRSLVDWETHQGDHGDTGVLRLPGSVESCRRDRAPGADKHRERQDGHAWRREPLAAHTAISRAEERQALLARAWTYCMPCDCLHRRRGRSTGSLRRGPPWLGSRHEYDS